MIAINGYGKMGRAVAERLHTAALVIEPEEGRWMQDGNVYVHNVQSIDVPPEVIIDFSHHGAIEGLAGYAVAHRVPLVVATTGHTAAERGCIYEAAKHIPVFYAPNTAFSMAGFASACLAVLRTMPQATVSVHEIHRAGKADAPSGTARWLADMLAAECGSKVPITYERIGDEVGMHEVTIEDEGQCVVLRHRVKRRSVFADGALTAARWLRSRPAGLYGINDLCL